MPPPNISTSVALSVFLCPSDAGASYPNHMMAAWGSYPGQGAYNWALTNYAFNTMVMPGYDPGSTSPNPTYPFPNMPYPVIQSTFPDGTSNTLIFAERLQGPGTPAVWGLGYPFSDHHFPGFFVVSDANTSWFNPGRFDVGNVDSSGNRIPTSPHSGAMPAAFADGSVRNLSASMNGATVQDGLGNTVKLFYAICSPNGSEVLPDY